MTIEELKQDLNEVNTALLNVDDRSTAGALVAERNRLERQLIQLERGELMPKVKVGQTHWTRPWMRGRVS